MSSMKVVLVVVAVACLAGVALAELSNENKIDPHQCAVCRTLVGRIKTQIIDVQGHLGDACLKTYGWDSHESVECQQATTKFPVYSLGINVEKTCEDLKLC